MMKLYIFIHYQQEHSNNNVDFWLFAKNIIVTAEFLRSDEIYDRVYRILVLALWSAAYNFSNTAFYIKS